MYAKGIAITIITLSVVTNTLLAKSYSLDGYMLLEGLQTFNGGLGHGSVYNAVLNPILNYNFTSYPGSSVRLGVLAIGDSDNTFQYTNALQNISNMSAQRELRLSELSYFHQFSRDIDVRVGIMDVRDYLNSYDVPKELFNSGFGTNRVMNNITNVSTYPYSGLGAILQYTQQSYSVQASVFQGDPEHIKSVFKHGALFLEQLNFNFDINHQNKQIFYLKFGAWQNYQPISSVGFSNIGTYVMGQYAWLTDRAQQMSVFAEIGYNNKQENRLPFSLAAGVTVEGLLPGRNKDKAAFGATSIWLRNLNTETVLELTYAIHIFASFFINPDIQYIINPRGYLANSWAGVLRLTYIFDGHLIERR